MSADAVRMRAEEALGGYVGEMSRIRNSIKLACKLIDEVQGKRAGKGRKQSG